MNTINNENFSCIDLFAGCGGLSLGLREAGWKGIFAIERDPMAFETLSKNFLTENAPYASFSSWPTWLPKTNHDIVSILGDSAKRSKLQSLRGQVTLMAGGPPCQGFSVGGRRDGADERNSLVFKMLEMVDLVRPKIVLIENVEGIARRFVARPGETISSISDTVSVAEMAIDKLAEIGYTSAFQVLNSSSFGVPQSRKRVVIIGLHNSHIDSVALKDRFSVALSTAAKDVRQYWGLHPTNEITARDAIEDLHGGKRVACPDSEKYETSSYVKANSAFAKAMRRGAKAGSIPNSHRFSKHGERVQALYRLAHETQPPGRLAKTFLLENNTKKDKKVLIDPNAVVSTITTHPDEFIHYIEPRNVTVREMARLQSFPDDFHFHGRYTINGPRRKLDVARCSQVGNAVPPLMAHGIGLAVRYLLSSIQQPKEIISLKKKRSIPQEKTAAEFAI